MGKITHLGPGHDFGRGHFPKSFGFSSHNRGPKTPAMPKARSGPATPMPGDGRHGGGFPMSDGGQLAPRSMPAQFAQGGRVKSDAAQDKALVKKGVGQHEDQLHDGKRATLKLAKGGHVGTPRISKAAKKAAAALREPVNRPPRDPMETRTAHNDMPGGEMPYGVQPSDEPDVAGSDQGIPQLRKGGKIRKR